eukprot:3977853-Lingulodinium_polyedra.AAC.1
MRTYARYRGRQEEMRDDATGVPPPSLQKQDARRGDVSCGSGKKQEEAGFNSLTHDNATYVNTSTNEASHVVGIDNGHLPAPHL